MQHWTVIFSVQKLAIIVCVTLPAVGLCDTATAIKFGKVYDYVHSPREGQAVTDEALRFETRYHSYGAVTNTQQQQRYGHYFTYNWKALGKTVPTRMEWNYLTEMARDKNGKKIVRDLPDKKPLRGWRRARFTVSGEEFLHEGRVIAWRLRIYSGSELLGETASFAWPEEGL